MYSDQKFRFFGNYTTLVTYKEVEKVVQYLQNRITIRIFGSRSVFVTIMLINNCFKFGRMPTR